MTQSQLTIDGSPVPFEGVYGFARETDGGALFELSIDTSFLHLLMDEFRAPSAIEIMGQIRMLGSSFVLGVILAEARARSNVEQGPVQWTLCSIDSVERTGSAVLLRGKAIRSR